MRLVIQRVREARVEVDGIATGAIAAGLLVLVAVAKTDTAADADYLAYFDDDFVPDDPSGLPRMMP